MDRLQIRLFGGFEVHAGQNRLPSFATEKSKSLFAFLVLNRDRLFHRDVLCGRFWGDQPDSNARRALRTALWRIRSVVEPQDCLRGSFLRVEGQQVGFPGTGDAWVDANEFTRRISSADAHGRGGLTPEDARSLADAVILYRGDLLEGLYDDWCLVDRERLRMALLTALERLVSYHREREEWLDAIDWGRQLLREDPLREHIHRAVMECHMAMGDRPSALRQYASCAQVLREELDLDPMEETTRLYRRVRASSTRRSQLLGEGLPTQKGRTAVRGLVGEVEDALEVVYGLAERLERTRSALTSGEGGPPD